MCDVTHFDDVSPLNLYISGGFKENKICIYISPILRVQYLPDTGIGASLCNTLVMAPDTLADTGEAGGCVCVWGGPLLIAVCRCCHHQRCLRGLSLVVYTHY